ncbi:MAG TPA: DUF4352 domain-containing protein [Beutenbergiaceae bacterium]|nr:DUF4352 domain-containing protein [Beutenbergiaceae bacterium]
MSSEQMPPSSEQMSPMNAADAKRQAKGEMAAAKARAKAERPFWKKKRVIAPAALALLLGIAVASGDGDDEAELVAAADAATPDSAADAAVEDAAEEADDEAGSEVVSAAQEEPEEDVADGFGLGDTIAMGDLEHTFHGARFVEGDEFFSPDEGTAWLVVDVEVTNIGDESEALSSLIMWRLVDAENRSADQELLADTQGSVDGELGADRSMRGEIAYEVGVEDAEWELIFEPALFGFGQGIYSFTVDEVG